MQWTTKMEAELITGIARLMEEGKILSHAIKEMAEKMGVSFDAAMGKYYRYQKQQKKMLAGEATAAGAGSFAVTSTEISTEVLPAEVLPAEVSIKSSGEAPEEEELREKMDEQAQANVRKYRAIDEVEALNQAYKKLMEESRLTNDGRLDSETIEKISVAVGLPYARVLSLWGLINQRGFWMKAELHKLQGIIESQKIELETLRQELKERAEAMDKYVNRAEKVKAALRAKLAESQEALAEQKKRYEVLLVVARSLQRFARTVNSYANDADFKMATKINLMTNE